MSLFLRRKTMADVLGHGTLPPRDTTFDGARNCFVVHADDSIVSDHLCPEMQGARVGAPKMFEGSGNNVKCPFCHQSI